MRDAANGVRLMPSETARPARDNPALARTLVAVSFGLGVAELFAPALVAAAAGVSPTPGATSAIRWLGVREVCHGLAILSSPRLVWTRVAGDVVDVALLAAGHKRVPTSRRRGLIAAVVLTAVGGLDIAAARRYAGTR
jgi:hypothetical protein